MRGFRFIQWFCPLCELRFIKRLCNFFKPSNHIYSTITYSEEHSRKYSSVGQLLVKYLCRAEDVSGGLCCNAMLSVNVLVQVIIEFAFMPHIVCIIYPAFQYYENVS